jgi:glycosyltransferase involved in cell wall biosynthesis
MKIGILGTRGIPNRYGGFEQFAEHLSVELVKRGHEVVVYTSKSHPLKLNSYKGVSIARIYDPEDYLSTAGQFIYDFLSIWHSRGQKFDLILQLGYTSSAIFYRFHTKDVPIVTNMDGLEWKRSKYSYLVKKFLSLSEKLAVIQSDYLIADSVEIGNYIEKKYYKKPTFIPYGATVAEEVDEEICKEFDLQKNGYDMLVARLEPENNIEMILDGVVASKTDRKFLVIGKNETKYGKFLKNRYEDYSHILFIGGIYDIKKLNSLRSCCNIYFHGHSVGGTNPSLLEAMSSQAFICAHDNPFNRAVLEDDAMYFNNSQDIVELLLLDRNLYTYFISNNTQKIHSRYNWKNIVNSYENFFRSICKV